MVHLQKFVSASDNFPPIKNLGRENFLNDSLALLIRKTSLLLVPKDTRNYFSIHVYVAKHILISACIRGKIKNITVPRLVVSLCVKFLIELSQTNIRYILPSEFQ